MVYRTSGQNGKRWKRVLEKTFEDEVSSIAFNSDGALFALSLKKGLLVLFGARDWKEITRSKMPGSHLRKIGFNKSGYLLVLVDKGKIFFYVFNPSDKIFYLHGTVSSKKEIISLAFNLQTRRLVVLQKNVIRGFDFQKDFPEVITSKNIDKFISSIEFSPSGKYIVFGGSDPEEGKCFFEIRDADFKQLQYFSEEAQGFLPNQFAFDFDDQYFAVLFANENIRIYKKKTEEPYRLRWRKEFADLISPFSITFSPEIKPVKVKKKSAKKKKKKKRKGDIEEIIEI